MLEKLGDATMFVGQKMAPVVKTQANKYLPERFKVGGGEEKDANKITATDKVSWEGLLIDGQRFRYTKMMMG